jgi:hypothetical protein
MKFSSFYEEVLRSNHSGFSDADKVLLLQVFKHCSQIDFILVRREDMHACLDCKVIPGECVVPQHKLVIADFRFRVRFQRSKRVQALKTKW